MSDDRPADRFRENVTEITSVLVTGIWLAAMFTGQSWWLAALLVGYIVVVPIVALLFGDEADRTEWWDDDWGWDWSWGESNEEESVPNRVRTDHRAGDDRTTDEPSTRDAMETLRERYAHGELTDEQFEAKLERLLGTETVENAEEWVRQRERAREQRQREFE